MTKKYTGFVGQKFNEDGSARRFPGNTVISKITPDMPVYAGVVEAQEHLKGISCADKYGFLPASSLHMTVIEGVCDQIRKAENWSSKLPLDMPLDEVNEFVVECFKKLSLPESFNMRLVRVRCANLMGFGLEPADEETAQSLKDFRDAFAQETGIRFPGHDTYGFHISFAYNLIERTDRDNEILKAEEKVVYETFIAKHPTFQLTRPEMTLFDDMFRFDTVV